jgi:membrane protein implicated in regulation of membrane protease activity
VSLKAFHIFFISLSVLMCLGIGAFRAEAYADTGEIGALAQATVCGISALALVVYARRFLKKTKDLGYL